MTTQQEARFWAETATEIMFSEGDPFCDRVSRDSLVKNLYDKMLEKLVLEDTSDLTEEEFQACVKLSHKNFSVSN